MTFISEVKGPSSSQIERSMMDAYRQGLEAFRSAIQQTWWDAASESLDSTLQTYMSGLTVTVANDGIEATLNGWMPVVREVGSDKFDMKPGLLKNRSSRVIPMHDGGFRTVSTTSPASSWWHPGFEAKNINDEVFKKTDELLAQSFGKAFDRVKV